MNGKRSSAASISAALVAALVCAAAMIDCSRDHGSPSGPVLPIKQDTLKPVKEDTVKPVAGLDTAALVNLLSVAADSGISLGKAFILAKGWGVESDPVRVSLRSDTASVSYSVRQFGWFTRIVATSHVQSGSFQRDRQVSVLAGNALPLDDFPSYGQIGISDGLALALQAELEGPIYMPKGQFEIVTQSYDPVYYTGHSAKPVIWDSASAFAKKVPFPFEPVKAWVQARVADLARTRSGLKPAGGETWDSTAIVPAGSILTSGAWNGMRLYCPGKLTLGDGSVVKDCQLVADEVLIQGNAQVTGGAVVAAGAMSIEGRPSLGGQFIAGDSLRLDVTKPLAGFPIFYVLDRDTSGVAQPHLDVVRATGDGVFLFSRVGRFNPNFLPGTINFGPETDLRGLAYTTGDFSIAGRFRGSILGGIPIFYKSPTIYVHFLGYGDLAPAPLGTVVPFGGIWSDAEINLTSRRP